MKAGSGVHGRAGDSLPAGLHVAQADAAASAISGENGARNVARQGSTARPVTTVSADRATPEERQVFGGKRFYSLTLNMPNLSSSFGSWVIHFAELKANQPAGELLAPVATVKSDPSYPMELIRENVQGTVTLYAVIRSDGSVGNVRVLNSPDDRLDNFARNALERWRFVPATKNGVPVALEAVVKVPFRVKRSF
jgi:TonB family protein